MRHNVEVGRDALSRDAPWEAVVKEMGGKRTTMQCRKKWYVLFRSRVGWWGAGGAVKR